ncbi:SusC/RagA family TonB-linked outer membrane protein [Algoriphagus halophytocola]|uniref:SusC/RagA family TonB-linked outer membrane protein n=1 Tax=Algoriphagus halophytocola TaxID=2991499 RepID=UPI0022DDAB80|nr:SusC/RagA family TonB-linked outer membrane protein [Algoriphagus sp. TR-M9]WBL44269.1 SusC/RagA family TonB-linked outer membrane protein [Algoriphagus sp. TR-M9]
MKRLLLIIYLIGLITGEVFARQNSPVQVEGKVSSLSQGLALPGVSVLVKGTAQGVVTETDGSFVLMMQSGNYTLVFSYIGYTSKEVNLTVPQDEPLEVFLEEDEIALASVEVVSTGLQELSSERSAGSFVQVDNTLVNRRISTNILDRLEDVTPGLVFNRDGIDREPGENISIRGKSTFLYDNQPLVVVDNLAYDGPIENINPNDVESITVLRDATAASIWGARAGNGVIVIKTKRGSFDSPMRVGLNSNVTIGEAWDAFYTPKMDISDFIEVEQRLYNSGFYSSRYNSYDKQALSPWVEDQFALTNGELTEEGLMQRKAYYQGQDVREDLQKYFYRPSLSQQYALDINGGSSAYSYLFSLGYDHNEATQVERSRSRITLNAQQNWKFWGDKLGLSLGTYLIRNRAEDGFPNITNLYPYDRLVDANGKGLPVFQNYNVRFKEQAMQQGALDWNYIPLNEIGMSPGITDQNEIRINLGLDYKIWKGLTAQLNYQYWNSNQDNEKLNTVDSYFSRNQINLFTEFPADRELIRNIPEGSIYDYGSMLSESHNLRGQLNFQQNWEDTHELTALAGFEVKDFQSTLKNNRVYGYDAATGIPTAVNYQVLYPQLNTGYSAYIPYGDSFDGRINRFVSYFANAGYTFRQKYLLNASIRSDASNLYGVEANLKRVPLWSAGLGWIASEEKWMTASWLDYLKLKASYGFNGNTNPAATAYTTAMLFPASSNPWVNQPWLSVLSPPNPQARWEKIKIVNTGLEFELFDSKLRGSVEGYRKEGLDLFGEQPFYPSSGNAVVTRNYANTRTYGTDIELSSRLISGEFNWTVSAFYSYMKEKVTRYEQEPLVRNVASYGGGGSFAIPQPVVGKPLQYNFTYPFAGLDPQTGEPMGILDGEPSTDYSAILSQTALEDLEYHGSAIPTHFGAFRNNLSWKGWDFSVNVSYRMGYYFKRETIDYASLNRGGFQHADYSIRWQQPGDETITFIGSDPLVANNNRNTFEQNHSGHIRKGDHIRLQDIRLSYTLDRLAGIQRIQIYSYSNNLGILWKSAKDVRDPDYRNTQMPRTYSFGLTVDF